MRVIAAQDTPNGTRMMWKPRVKAICDRAHGTGSTALRATLDKARVAVMIAPSTDVQPSMPSVPIGSVRVSFRSILPRTLLTRSRGAHRLQQAAVRNLFVSTRRRRASASSSVDEALHGFTGRSLTGHGDLHVGVAVDDEVPGQVHRDPLQR